MSFDLNVFAKELRNLREKLNTDWQSIAQDIHLSEERLIALENAEGVPTGDEVLILADYFMVDFRVLISGKKSPSDYQTEILFRSHGNHLTTADRRAIQEALFLCESEAYMRRQLNRAPRKPFTFEKKGGFFKKHGEAAAASLRRHLGFKPERIPSDIYSDFRGLGLHVFRRWFHNRDISGMCIRHPEIGHCILINYTEDPYRQRFTAAHEVAHAILDNYKDVVFTLENYEGTELSEVRANTFASRFLMPPEFLQKIPSNSSWTPEKAVQWANHMKVSTEALGYALFDADLIDKQTRRMIQNTRVPAVDKIDPELPNSLTEEQKNRRQGHLKRGLSTYYVNLCLEAFDNDLISVGKLAEVLLTAPAGVNHLLRDFGRI